MLPKITFQYSRIYDYICYHFSTGKHKELNDPLFMKREKYCLDKIKTIKKWWDPKGSTTLRKISNLTGINWTQKEINIYFLAEPHRNTWVGGFSNPLTLFLKKIIKGRVIKEDMMFIKTGIVHELVHYNIPLNKIDPTIDKFQKRFSCDRIAATHVIIHAILDKIFSKEELEYDIKKCHNHKSYEKAWDIVKSETSDKILRILKTFKK